VLLLQGERASKIRLPIKRQKPEADIKAEVNSIDPDGGRRAGIYGRISGLRHGIQWHR